MPHPALTQTLATAHIDDLHRAAARWRTIHLARRVAHESHAWRSRLVHSGAVEVKLARVGPGPVVDRQRAALIARGALDRRAE